MRLARQIRRCDLAALQLLVQVTVEKHGTEERRLGLGILRRGLRRDAVGEDRHTGIPLSSARLKKRACSLSKYSSKCPVGPLRFFATEPLMSRGAPVTTSSLSRQSMITMSLSCSMDPLSRRVESFGSFPESPAARDSCESAITVTPKIGRASCRERG